MQTNWMQSASHDTRDIDRRQPCVDDADNFLATCEALRPRVIVFLGRTLIDSLAARELRPRVTAIFGEPTADVLTKIKDVYVDGKRCRPLSLAFQDYERLRMISLSAGNQQGV